MIPWLLVFLGGGLGSVFRFSLSRLAVAWEWHHWPIATLAANVMASTLLAWLVFALRIHTSSNLYFFLAVGLCGGFSTFSTFSLECFEWLKAGEWQWAAMNVLLNTAICLAAMAVIFKLKT